MKKILLITLLFPLITFSQNEVMQKKMEYKQSMMKKKSPLNPKQAKKKIEAKIIDKWEEYSKAFEYSDFEKIKTYFTYPVTLSVFGNPTIINNENDLVKFYKQIRNQVQDGYKYSMLEKSRVIWISKEICMLDATYSRFNDNYKRIYTGRGIYMYKRIDKSWKMFSMSSIEMKKNKK